MNKKVVVVICGFLVFGSGYLVGDNVDNIKNIFSTKFNIISEAEDDKSKNNDQNKNDGIEQFGVQDTKIDNIALNMSLEDVIKELGQPKKSETITDSSLGYDSILYYSFGQLGFNKIEDNKTVLTGISINKVGINGPRNILIGDSVQSLLNKFPNENFPKKHGIKKIYGNDYENRGIINYDKLGKISNITFYYGSANSDTYWIDFRIENDKVKEIEIGIESL